MKTILCGIDMPPQYRAGLEKYADRVFVMPPREGADGPSATHPDMLGYAKGDALFLASDYYEANRAFFDGIGCRTVPCGVAYGDYPRDIYFNVFAVGDLLFGRTDMTPPEIKALYNECILLRQGYAKCSTLLLGGDGITADRGIAEALRENGSDALLIRPGGVLLRDYPYGFIGGAAVVPSEGVVFPVGDIDTHPDGASIRRFAKERGYIVDNGKAGEPLTDCGGILILEV